MTQPAFQVSSPLRYQQCDAAHASNLTSTRQFPTCVSTPPRRKGAVAKDLRDALQSSLRARTSRIDLVLPPGAALGTEVRPKEETLRTRIRTADRELARVVSGMFEGTGLTMRLIFPDQDALRDAERIWGKTTFEMVTWDTKSKSNKFAKKGGFGRSTTTRPNSEQPVDVYVLVGGDAAFLAKARILAEGMGDGKLVILLNANSSRDQLPVDLVRFRDQIFESVYYYFPNPHPKWSGGVLFRKFPDDWVLGRITPIGTLEKLIVTKEKPSLEDVAEALGKAGDKPENTILKKISGFLDWTGS